MQDYCVIFPVDENGLIRNFFSLKSDAATLIECADWESEAITHAIVFADDEVFKSEVEKINQLSIPLRRINIAITRVVNIKKDLQFAGLKSNAKYEYIGRGSYWGNPYSMFAEGESREEVIRFYKYDFDNEKFAKKEKSEVFKLAGKRLGCFCKPDACHGDILADFLNNWDDGK
jgi:hypothetical protein